METLGLLGEQGWGWGKKDRRAEKGPFEVGERSRPAVMGQWMT